MDAYGKKYLLERINEIRELLEEVEELTEDIDIDEEQEQD